MTDDEGKSDKELLDRAVRTMDSMDPCQTTYRQFWDRIHRENAEFFRRAKAPDASHAIRSLYKDALHFGLDGTRFIGWLHFSEDELINPPRPLPREMADSMVDRLATALEKIRETEPQNLDADDFEAEGYYFKSEVAPEDWPEIYERLKTLHRQYFPKL